MCLPIIYIRKYFMVAVLMSISVAAATQNSLTQPAKTFQNKLQSTLQKKDTVGQQSLLEVLKELNKKRGVFFLYAEENMSQRLVHPLKGLDGDIDKILSEVLKN